MHQKVCWDSCSWLRLNRTLAIISFPAETTYDTPAIFCEDVNIQHVLLSGQSGINSASFNFSESAHHVFSFSP